MRASRWRSSIMTSLHQAPRSRNAPQQRRNVSAAETTRRMKGSAAPLTVADLTAALRGIGGFEKHPFIAVAVSGGPDSLALTILADQWARQQSGRLAALTVDHRLRP